MRKSRWLFVLIISAAFFLLAGCGSVEAENEGNIPESSPTVSSQNADENGMVASDEALSEIQNRELDSATVIQQQETHTVYEFNFERDGMKIYGNLYLPKNGAEQFPVAIMAHGFGSSYSNMALYASVLAENGIASYIFDFCGGSTGSRSDGDMLHMSVLTERADMETVLDELRSYDFVNQNQMFLMGESQGGLVAALLATQRKEDIRGLALLYPALVIPDDAREQYSDIADIPETAYVFGMRVGRIYYEDVLDMNVFDDIAAYDGNVLIIHGSNDSIVPISYSERAVDTYTSAELVVLDGAGHGFYGADRDEAAEGILNFIMKNIE